MIQLLLALAVVGLILYLFELIPMDATIRRAIQAIAIFVVVIWAITRVLPLAGLH